MNKNLNASFLILILAIALPIGSLSLQLATPKWPEFWQVRAFLVTYSGIVTMILMSLTIILCAKNRHLEKWLSGLDQQYRLHKYLGITTVFCALLHWLSFMSDDIAMEQGFIAATEEKYPFFKLINWMGDPAQFLGEWGFYLSAFIVFIAWAKYFAHHIFQLAHKLLPYIYLLLVIHMLIFLDIKLWLSPPGIVLAITTLLASISSLLAILGINGKNNRSLATLNKVTSLKSGVEITLQLASNTQTYQAGQFAFIRFDQKENAHPFSLASKVTSEGKVRFLIKANGDYTNTFANNLNLGQQVQLEGPYGYFDFIDEAKHHVWIATGIGIAPFLSALENIPKNTRIDLFYTYSIADEILLSRLMSRAKKSNVRLHLINTSTSPRLTPNDILKTIKDISICSVWYCGSLILGDLCEKALRKAGLASHSFHRELFNFR